MKYFVPLARANAADCRRLVEAIAPHQLSTRQIGRLYHVYVAGPEATREHAKIHGVVGSLFDHYCAHPDEIPVSIPAGPLERRVTDYIAGMTDRFCIRVFEALSVPVSFAP